MKIKVIQINISISFISIRSRRNFEERVHNEKKLHFRRQWDQLTLVHVEISGGYFCNQIKTYFSKKSMNNNEREQKKIQSVAQDSNLCRVVHALNRSTICKVRSMSRLKNNNAGEIDNGKSQYNCYTNNITFR
jgi:hypothetical protein